MERKQYSCVLFGSFRKMDHLLEVQSTFVKGGVEIVAPPKLGTPISILKPLVPGFIYLAGQEAFSPAEIQGRCLAMLPKINHPGGFVYVANGPDGEVGVIVGHECGISKAWERPHYFERPPRDHRGHKLPMLVPNASIRSPEEIINHIKKFGKLPPINLTDQEMKLARIWDNAYPPGKTSLAVGVVFIDKYGRILLIKDPRNYGEYYTVPGDRLRINEPLFVGMIRGCLQKIGILIDLERAKQAKHIITFDGRGPGRRQSVFVDYAVEADLSRQRLPCWSELITPAIALHQVPLEPNAKKTIVALAKMIAA